MSPLVSREWRRMIMNLEQTMNFRNELFAWIAFNGKDHDVGNLNIAQNEASPCLIHDFIEAVSPGYFDRKMKIKNPWLTKEPLASVLATLNSSPQIAEDLMEEFCFCPSRHFGKRHKKLGGLFLKTEMLLAESNFEKDIKTCFDQALIDTNLAGFEVFARDRMRRFKTWMTDFCLSSVRTTTDIFKKISSLLVKALMGLFLSLRYLIAKAMRGIVYVAKVIAVLFWGLLKKIHYVIITGGIGALVTGFFILFQSCFVCINFRYDFNQTVKNFVTCHRDSIVQLMRPLHFFERKTDIATAEKGIGAFVLLQAGQKVLVQGYSTADGVTWLAARIFKNNQMHSGYIYIPVEHDSADFGAVADMQGFFFTINGNQYLQFYRQRYFQELIDNKIEIRAEMHKKQAAVVRQSEAFKSNQLVEIDDDYAYWVVNPELVYATKDNAEKIETIYKKHCGDEAMLQDMISVK